MSQIKSRGLADLLGAVGLTETLENTHEERLGVLHAVTHASVVLIHGLLGSLVVEPRQEVDHAVVHILRLDLGARRFNVLLHQRARLLDLLQALLLTQRVDLLATLLRVVATSTSSQLHVDTTAVQQRVVAREGRAKCFAVLNFNERRTLELLGLLVREHTQCDLTSLRKVLSHHFLSALERELTDEQRQVDALLLGLRVLVVRGLGLALALLADLLRLLHLLWLVTACLLTLQETTLLGVQTLANRSRSHRGSTLRLRHGRLRLDLRWSSGRSRSRSSGLLLLALQLASLLRVELSSGLGLSCGLRLLLLGRLGLHLLGRLRLHWLLSSGLLLLTLQLSALLGVHGRWRRRHRRAGRVRIE